MFKSFLKTTLRKLAKDRLYTLINLAGLSVGFAMFLLIGLYIQRELATDSHHQGFDRIYRVDSEYTNQKGVMTRYASGYQPTAKALRSDWPEVEASVMFFSPAAQFSFRSGDQMLSVENTKIYYTTADFFDIFDQQWRYEGTGLSAPNTVVISSLLSERFFGDEDPIGQTLVYESRGDKYSLEVSGVFEKTNRPSHLDYDMLIQYDSGINFWKGGIDNNWGFMYVYTYFKANQDIPSSQWTEPLARLRTKYKPQSESIRFEAKSLKDIYWSPSEFEPGVNGNKAYLYVFGAFGFTVILLAIVNFVNLMTARSIRRSREVAVRKVIGASRSGLMTQFLVESTTLSAIAVLIGAVLAERMIGPINAGLDLSLTFNIFGNAALLISVLLLPLAVGALSGLYPALVLSATRAHQLLGGRQKWSLGKNRLRDGLLVFQFLISVLVISAVLIISNQMDYIRSNGLGFQDDPMVVLPRIGNNSNYLIRQQVAENPNIRGIASLSSIPGYRIPRQRYVKENGTTGDGIQANGIWVSEDYADMIGMAFEAGRNFTVNDRENTIILNQRAVADLGWEPAEALGKLLVMTGRNGFDATTYEVIGVIEDYHYQSMYEQVAPLFLKNNSLSRSGGDASLVQISKGHLDQTLAYLEGVWSEIEKTEAFDYYFLDDAVNTVYEKEVKLARTVKYVSATSMVICMLGLFGLVSLNLQSRKKEIGIRKVLGAKVGQIARLFTRKYLLIISLSVLLGLPLSYQLLDMWLSNFAYNVNYSFTTYFGVGLGLMALSLSLVGLQSAGASQTNPVDSLRDE